MRRAFLGLVVVNIMLVVLYVIADIHQWGVLQGFYGYGVSVDWMFLQINIAYGRQYDGAIADGMITMYNWSFTIVLVIIALNIGALWRITRKVSR